MRTMFPFTVPTASGAIADKINTFGGFCLENTGAGTLKVRVRDTTPTGKIVASVSLAAGAIAADNYAAGVRVDGIYVEIVSGTGTDLAGTIWGN